MLTTYMICFQAYRLLIDLANFFMAVSAGCVIVIGVPPRHDGTIQQIRDLNALLALDRGFGYKFIGVGCSFGNSSILGHDKVHLDAIGKSKLKRLIKNKIIC